MKKSNGRDKAGRFQRGNVAALVHGRDSLQVWAAQASLRRAVAAEMLQDRGFTETDAPRALAAAVDGAAQAILLRDSAFERIVEMGGAHTLRGRPRSAFTTWLAASDRAEKLLRLVGLTRTPRKAPSLTESILAAPEVSDE